MLLAKSVYLVHFFAATRVYRHTDAAISLLHIWMVDSKALNDWAETIWEHIRREKDLVDLHRNVVRTAQALIEFWDLANFWQLTKGRFL